MRDLSFPQQVYALARRIPRGRVASYGQLAALAGRPRAARIAGGAMSRCPEGADVPCHRVVKADGSLCEGYEFGIPGLQRQLLLEEGVRFLPDGRVDMRSCQWNGLPADYSEARTALAQAISSAQPALSLGVSKMKGRSRRKG